jgi:hypothetical protein
MTPSGIQPATFRLEAQTLTTVLPLSPLTHCASENKGKNPLDKVRRCMLPSGESFPHESRSYVQEGPAPPRRI